MINKICSRCKIEKSLEDFSFNNICTNKKMSACKKCMNEAQRKFRKDNPVLQRKIDKSAYLKNRDKRIAYAKEYRKKYKDKTRNTNLKTRYGIDSDQYEKIKKIQLSKCGICHKKEYDLKKILFVDHCHNTNKVRGLLCDNCNKFLGFYEKHCKAANSYLQINGSHIAHILQGIKQC